MAWLAKIGRVCQTSPTVTSATTSSDNATALAGFDCDRGGDADAALAAAMAQAAGQALLALRESKLFAGRDLGRAGDAVSQELLRLALSVHRPDDSVLSEEAAEDPARLGAERVWIIDPLDGTREYGEGREDWAVHVALAIGGRPGPSAVALPARGAVFSSAQIVAAQTEDDAPLRIAVSRSRAPEIAQRVADDLGAELVPMGSAGVKAIAVLTGEVDAYLHAGGQYEWDSAAPVGVVSASGLHCSRIDGSPLVYNRPDPLLADLLICREAIAERVLASIAKHSAT
jgi:3'(2'), 5'-bisphosphate nucleotidase